MVDKASRCIRIELPEPLHKGQILRGSPFGLNLQLAMRGWSFEEMESALAICEQMGIKWSREEFQWHQIMPERGRFQWERIERSVDMSLDHGVSIMGLFAYWDGPWEPSAGPIVGWTDAYHAGGIQDYCTLIRATVRRLKDRVKVWQIWNEPNGRVDAGSGRDILRGFWKGTPQQYADLLRASYETCKDEDPDCTVVGFNCALCDLEWLQMQLDLGMHRYADIVSFHPYRWLQNPDDKADSLAVRCFDDEHPARWFDHVDEAKAVRALVKHYAGHEKPVWVTELSWSAALNAAGLQELDVAKNHLRSHLLLLGPGGIEKVFWYDLRTPNVGLAKPDFGPRYLSAAACMLSRAIEGKRFVRAYPVGDGNYALLWQGDEDVLALWSARPTPQFVSLDLADASEWQLVDMFGMPPVAADPDEYHSTLVVPISGSPQFLMTRSGGIRSASQETDYLYELPRDFGPGYVPEDPYGTKAAAQP